MTMGWLRPAATICTAAVVFVGAAQAKTLGPSWGDSRLTTQAPADQTVPKMQALQVAIDSKDTTAILNLLSRTARDQRKPIAALLLLAAHNLVVTDKQFAASPAALTFASGGLTGAQQNIAVAVIRNAPGGLAIVANLLSNSPTGGFGLSNVTMLALVDLVVAVNQNQAQASPT
jgi:hypothetical protein